MHASKRSLLTLLAVCATAASLLAQPRPDFTGRWVEDESQRKSPYASAPATGVRAVAAPDVPTIITHTAAQLIVERDFMEKVRHVHDLDGRENKNRNGAQVHTTRTKWEGNRLVTEGTTYQVTSQGETSWKVKEVRWLTPKGELAIETTHVDEDGDAKTVFRVFRRER
jgi:hypothetical protein